MGSIVHSLATACVSEQNLIVTGVLAAILRDAGGTGLPQLQ